MFAFRFFRTIGGQKAALLGSTDFAEVPLHPAIANTLDELGHLGTPSVQVAGIHGTQRGRVWLESLRVVLPLLIRSMAWQSVAIMGLVVSLLATRYVLTSHSSVPMTILICCSFLVAELTKNLVFYCDIQRRSQLARGIQLHLFARVNRKLLVIDPAESAEFTSGNVKTLISGDVEAIEDFITAASQAWMPAVLALALTSGPILYLTGTLGAVGIAVTLVQVPLAYFSARYVERFKERRQGEQDRLTTIIGEWVRNVRLVRYLNWEEAIAREVKTILRRFSFEAAKAHAVMLVAFAITYSWWTVPILAMIVYGSSAGIPVDAASFFPAIWLLSLLSSQIQFLPHSLTQYGSAAAGMTRLVRFLNLPEITRHVVRSANSGVGELGIPIRIHLQKVSVTYGEQQAIHDLTCRIELAQRTAVVGEVGAGKSTLLRLLAGEQAPTSGEIAVEFSSGITVSAWSEEGRRLLRESLAYAPQEPFLSNATLRENIDLFGTRPDEVVAAAVHDAVLDIDIAQLEHGLNQEVGETGINLSGGQKQRVSLARAFVSQRPYLLLDDPLSAVDARTERALFEAFVARSKGFVLVSHRLEQLGACDRVLVMSDGKLVEDGGPVQLSRSPESHFHRLLEARRARGSHD